MGAVGFVILFQTMLFAVPVRAADRDGSISKNTTALLPPGSVKASLTRPRLPTTGERPNPGEATSGDGDSVAPAAPPSADSSSGPATEEVCRIRIENRDGGEIGVSTDNGHSYTLVGHVLTCATSLIPGFSATEWAQSGTICATAVHGLRICVNHNASQRGMLVNIVPREYRRLPDSFGGQRSGSAGIYTDIAASSSIFRNLAPLVGNPVFLEHEGVLDNLRTDYSPHPGDVLVIMVQRPALLPVEIDFGNLKGGLVEEVFSGGERVTVGQVLHPVFGTGRYDGTSFTGVGRINTNHPGVITVSTAEESGVAISDEERGWERRGGFQIIPSVHAARDLNAPPPSVMVVGPAPGETRPLEGTPPLFSGLIGLTDVDGDPASSYRVEVKIDHGAWEPMPDFVGIDPLFFTAAPLMAYFADKGIHREIHHGITDVRILFPQIKPGFAAEQVQLAVSHATRSQINISDIDDRDALVRGAVHVNVNLRSDDPRVKFVVLMVDGAARCITDAKIRPYDFNWDTRQETNGHHTVTIKGEDGAGAVITQATSGVIVANALAH